jgi:hypothetical protein
LVNIERASFFSRAQRISKEDFKKDSSAARETTEPKMTEGFLQQMKMFAMPDSSGASTKERIFAEPVANAFHL